VAESSETSAYKQRIWDLATAGKLEEANAVYEEMWDQIEKPYSKEEIERQKTKMSRDEKREFLKACRKMLKKEAGWKPWPGRVLRVLPKPGQDLSSAEPTKVAECQREIVALARGRVRKLVALRRKLEKFDTHGREEFRTFLAGGPFQKLDERQPLDSLQLSNAKKEIENAIAIVSINAEFARREVEGKAFIPMGDPERQQGGVAGVVANGEVEPVTRSRLPDPIRARVAREYAGGWTDPTTGETWMPTARDLALLSICYGCEVLPSNWRNMSPAKLIEAEKRAMSYCMTDRK
jgi:hypothetical protein